MNTKQIHIITALPAIHSGNVLSLDLFLKSIKFIQNYFTVKLSLSANQPSIETFQTDLNLIKEKLSGFDASLYENYHLNQLDEKSEFSKGGLDHSLALDFLIEKARSSNSDFFLILDFDCYFMPSRIKEMMSILQFEENKKFVICSIGDQYQFRSNKNWDDLHNFNEKNININQDSFLRVPRINPYFFLVPNTAFNELYDKNLLNFHSLSWWNFTNRKIDYLSDEGDRSILADNGFLMMNVISLRDYTWIIKNEVDLPVFHYGGITGRYVFFPEESEKNLKILSDNLYTKEIESIEKIWDNGNLILELK